MRFIRNFFLLYFVFFLAILSAAEKDPDQVLFSENHIFVSLGSNCEVADLLSYFGLRHVALPFDWLLSLEIESISRLFDEDFEFLWDERFFEAHRHYPFIITNTHYAIDFFHEWKSPDDFWVDFLSYREKLPEIKKKYQRRICRLKKLNSYVGKVFFIRAAFHYDLNPKLKDREVLRNTRITSDEAIVLRNALRNYFPLLDFKLCIINYENHSPNPLNFDDEPEIVEFKIEKGKEVADYEKIFNTLLIDESWNKADQSFINS